MNSDTVVSSDFETETIQFMSHSGIVVLTILAKGHLL